MTDNPLSGGCLCGAVRYTVHAPPRLVWFCHCSMCRKASGSFFHTIGELARGQLSFEQGEDNLTDYDSSTGVRRQFCRTCGSPLFARDDDAPDIIYFLPATLDGGVHPGHPAGSEYHAYASSKAEWETIADALPQYDGMGPDEVPSPLEREQLNSGSE